ncbi:MAG TPA: class I SAM-dependent methyltransferase [Verrucomicrobiae bacterium]
MMGASILRRKIFRGRQALELIAEAVRKRNYREATDYVGKLCALTVGTAFPKLLAKSELPNGAEAQNFDAQFGIETSQPMRVAEMELEASANTVQASYYQPSSPALFRRIMAELNLDWPRFTFVDVGSGKGLVLLLASELPFERVLGVEFAENLHRPAVENISKFNSPTQRCRDIQSVCADATAFEFPAAPTVFYLFNPFGEEILTGFLANVQRSLKKHSREIFFVYVEPLFSSTLEQRGFVTKIAEFQDRPCNSYKIYKTA